MKSALAVAKINFKTSGLAYVITAIVIGSILINAPINIAIEANETYQISMGSYAYLLVALMAIFIPALHFRKFMNLNVKKSAYIKGCAINYGIVAVVVAAFNTLAYLTVDRWLTLPPRLGVWNLLDIFGWSANGLAVAFVQQVAFLLLVAAAVHLLTSIQTFWYGWVVDIVVVAILAVFIPIPVLRNVPIGFFNLIIFTSHAAVQIVACLVLAVGLYLLSILPVKSKPV